MKTSISVIILSISAPLFGHSSTDPIDKAKEEFQQSLTEASDELVQDIDKKIDAAQKRGSLDDIERLRMEKASFVKEKTLPNSVRTSSYQRKVKRAFSKVENAFEDEIEEAVKNNQIERATILRDEIEALKNSLTAVINPDAIAEFEMLKGIDEIVSLRLHEEVYSNREYAWKKIPSGLPFDRFARLPGGGKTELSYKVLKPGWIYIGLSAEKQEEIVPYLEQESWVPTKVRFEVTGNGDTTMYVFRKWYKIGTYQLPRLNFSGPIPLIPAESK